MAVLGNLIEQVRGVSYKPEDLHTTLNENSVVLLRANNIKAGQLNFEDVIYVDRKKVSEKQLLKAGDILICASSGSKELVGKAAYVDGDLPMTFGAFCKVVRPKTSCPQYIGHFFNSPYYRERIANSAAGANINNIRNEHIDVLEIVWPSIEEQRRTATVLDKVSELITLRKEQLAKLDQLVKSRFIELFGDPMANPMGWDRVNISAAVGGKLSNGFFAKRDDYCDDGNVKVLGVAHVVNRMYSNIEDLPKTNGTETDVVKYGVKYGDMLFCRSSLVAAGIGKASIVPKGTPNNVLFECHVIRLPLDLEKCVPEFLQVLSTTDYFRKQVIAQSKTATMTTIGQDGILKTDIILPPMEMQKKFLAFVEHTEKSKLAIQQSLDKLELLKKSLMQEYFG